MVRRLDSVKLSTLQPFMRLPSVGMLFKNKASVSNFDTFGNPSHFRIDTKFYVSGKRYSRNCNSVVSGPDPLSGEEPARLKKKE